MFDAYDRDDPGRQLPHHRFFVADRTRATRLRAVYHVLRRAGFDAAKARAEVTRILLHDDRAVFV